MDNEDNNDPTEEFGDELVEIKDFETMSDQLRRQGVSTFNERYKQDGISLGRKHGIFKNPRRLSKKTLERIIKIRDVKEILEKHLPYNKETENYSINVNLFWKCVDDISRNIFYNVASALVDAGIYEMIFDVETNDFAWRVSPEYRKKFKKDFKDRDETNHEGNEGPSL